jgi:hypothetical protein
MHCAAPSDVLDLMPDVPQQMASTISNSGIQLSTFFNDFMAPKVYW